MNNMVRNGAVTFMAVFFVSVLVFPLFSFASDDPFGEVVTFVPEIYKYNKDNGRVGFKGLVDLSDDTTMGNMWFEWGETSSLEKRTTSYWVGNTEALMYHSISNLDINDFYYYRAVAQESDGEYIYGSIIRFRIVDGYAESLGTIISDVGTIINTTNSYPAPVAITMIPQIVNDTTVIIRGEAKSNTSINTSGYFRWGTTPDLTSQTPIRGLGIGTFGFAFTETLTGLVPGTVYYYRAEVIGPGGRSVGSVLAFTTDGGLVTGFNQPLPTTVVTPSVVTPVISTASRVSSSVTPTPSTTTTNKDSKATEVDTSTSSAIAKDTSKTPSAQRGFWATIFGGGDDDITTTETNETSTNVIDEESNKQKALVVSNGGFFPQSIFGWIILTILIIFLVALFVYVQILHEQIKTLREERERGRNGNGIIHKS